VIYEAIVEASAPPGFKAANTFTPAQPTLLPNVASPSEAHASPDEEEEMDESQVGVGSIAAGGRYDNLVGLFTSAAAAEGKKGTSLPCIGVSIGLDRVFALLWPKWTEKGMRHKETMVFVMAAGDGLLQERVQLVQELREAGIKVTLRRNMCQTLYSSWLTLDGLSCKEEAQASSPVCRWREGRGTLCGHFGC
jgi:histidyl-tRNA synthetase